MAERFKTLNVQIQGRAFLRRFIRQMQEEGSYSPQYGVWWVPISQDFLDQWGRLLDAPVIGESTELTNVTIEQILERPHG